MKPEYDFSKAKRATKVAHLSKLRASVKGKTRITIMLDDDVIKSFAIAPKPAVSATRPRSTRPCATRRVTITTMTP